MKVRDEGKCESGPPQVVEVTMFNYFVKKKQTCLAYSSYVSCLDVSRRKKTQLSSRRGEHDTILCIMEWLLKKNTIAIKSLRANICLVKILTCEISRCPYIPFPWEKVIKLCG